MCTLSEDGQTKLCPTCKTYKPLLSFSSATANGQEADKSYKWCAECRWIKFKSPAARAKKAAARKKAQLKAAGKLS